MVFKKLLLTLIALAFGFHSFGGSLLGGEGDQYEKTFISNRNRLPDRNLQRQLYQSAPWQHFLSGHPKWNVIFNEENHKPHRAYGQPFDVTPGVDSKSTALGFIQNSLSEFNIPVNELKFQTSNTSKYQNVFFTQLHNGLDVLFSNFTVKMTLNNKVISWGADVFDNIQVNVMPALDEATAKNFASQNIPFVTNISKAVLKILPVAVDRSYDFHLVYEMTVSTNIPGSPAEYYTLVDAHSGEILYRQNQVNFSAPLNTDVNVTGKLYKTSLLSASSIEPLKNLKVVANSNTYYTDSVGDAPIPGVASQSATFSLEGYWSKVVTDQGTNAPSFTQTLGIGGNAAYFDTNVASIRHLSGYYHVNIVHDFMKQYLPFFTTMDKPLLTKIDVTSGSCNAFYNGSTINFYADGGGCLCMSQIADVVYHEYGHGISILYYQSQGSSWKNGSMGEGYSDVWAMSITHSPFIGQGYQGNSGSYFRRYDINKKVYPQDLTGEVHANGEIIAGAWYDYSLNVGSWSDMTALFTATYPDLLTAPNGSEGSLYTDILLSALQYDDDDADLSNGTPHFKQLTDAFALHGISLTNNTSITHTDVLAASSGNPIPVNVDLINSFPYIGANNLHLYYRTDTAGAWNKLPMSYSSGITYAATIPSQPGGTIIRYYVELEDTTFKVSQVLPVEANAADPNIPYFILVDYLSMFQDSLEDTLSTWTRGVPTDNAKTGKWVIGKPVSSLKIGVVVQPGIQHTPGGTNCAVTGNAKANLSMTNNDVDSGRTTLISPMYDVSTYKQPAVAFWRWYTNDQGGDPRKDFWQIYVSADGVNYVPVEYTDIPDHSFRRFVFHLEDFLPGATQFNLKFVAEDAGLETILEAAVDDIEIFGVGTVGLHEHPTMPGIFAYPNPAKDQLSISIPALRSGADLRIFNSIGDLVFEEHAVVSSRPTVKTISVKDFASGLYQLTLSGENGVSHLSVMVQH